MKLSYQTYFINEFSMCFFSYYFEGPPGAAGYGSAATMQQAYSYGAAAIANYGGAYNMAGQYGGAAGMPGVPAVGGRGGPVSQDPSFNETGYGAYRGQGAAQGRVDRSYRPY